MPGDALYGLKRSQETAQLQLSGSPASKGQLYLDFAGKRLAEAQSDTGDPNGLNQLINQMDSDTLQGARLLFAAALASHDKAALQTVADFYARQKDQLGQLRAQLRPEPPTYRLVLSYDNDLDLVNYRWQQINAALACPTVVQTARRQVGTQRRTVRLGRGSGQLGSAPATPRRHRPAMPRARPAVRQRASPTRRRRRRRRRRSVPEPPRWCRDRPTAACSTRSSTRSVACSA